MKKLFLSSIFCFLFFISFFVSTSFCKESMKLAVTDLEPRGVDSTFAILLSDLLRTELDKTKRFTIIERNNINEVLKVQQQQVANCYNTECIVKLGLLLQADKVILGSVNKTGKKFIINIRFIDVELGSVEFSEHIDCECEEYELLDPVSNLAKKIADSVPITGSVVLVKEDFIYLDIGKSDGVVEGKRLKIERFSEEIKDEKGNVLYRDWETVGFAEVVSVQESGCRAKVVYTNKDIVKDDKVTVTNEAPPTASIIADKEPPKITHNPITKAKPGDSLEVSAIVSDNVKLKLLKQLQSSFCK